MTDKNKAIILAVEAVGLPAIYGSKQHDGLHPMSHEDTIKTLADAGTWLGPRGRLEEDPRFRQIIPYVIIRQNGKIVTYVRGASGGEARLHGKLSIGLGGHIDLPDVWFNDRATVNMSDTLEGAADRELAEEVDLDSVLRNEIKWVGLLTCNETEVDRVHIGVVGVLDVVGIGEHGVVHPKEDSQENLVLMSPAELEAESSRLESWTRLCLPFLAADNESV